MFEVTGNQDVVNKISMALHSRPQISNLHKIRMYAYLFFFVAVLTTGCLARPAPVYDEAKIHVHLVPHTHDDVGWLKTVDEYYYGANNSIQHAGVQYILDSVVKALQLDESRKFIYVEMAFFSRWWNQQTEEVKNIVKKLVSNKQLEFINAGWCMNDEATPDYNSIIDQMSIGLKFVEDNFGPDARPRVAWHIDPFGHSSEQAALFAMMGYDGFFFGRNDYDDKILRLNKTKMEMVWKPSKSLGGAADIFTGVTYNNYAAPRGFCFDMLCDDQPIMDDPNLFDMNIDQRVRDFIKAIDDQAQHMATNHIMFTMGEDFQYENAHLWFKNMDKLMAYTIQKNSSLNLFYSTPTQYLDALNAANVKWPTKTDDFFPYADQPYAYWTGYFTSRPALKGYVREMNSFLQTCKHMEVLGVPLAPYRSNKLTSRKLQEAMGVAQHHDAVSGTEKQHVADDYAKRLHIGQVECEMLTEDVATTFMRLKTLSKPPKVTFCEYLNISVCPVTEKGSFNVMMYNPIGRTTQFTMRVPVSSDSFTVVDNDGENVPFQVVSVSTATESVRRKRGNAPYELFFTDSVPGMGMKTYFIRPSASDNTSKTSSTKNTPSVTRIVPQEGDSNWSLDSYPMSLTFDGTTGRLKVINNQLSNIKLNVDQGFMWYNSSDEHNRNSTQASGAYMFRPNGTKPFDVSSGGKVLQNTVVKGELYEEVQQKFAEWLYQSIRIYKNLPVEFEYTVGPIPFSDHLGKEVVSRFTTDLATDKTWYTDANGREMQKRVRNYRETWTLNSTEPVAQNYYPVNSRIYLRDENRKVQFTILNDRSQGGSSLNDGQLELMIHRRILYDDHRGVGEPLNETGQFGDGLIVRGKHIVLVDNFVNSTVLHRMIGEGLLTKMQPIFMEDTSKPAGIINKYNVNFTGMVTELPPNVHLLTLQVWGLNTYLLRLEHQFEADETPYNQPVDISLAKLFVFTSITEVNELVLSGNAPLSSVHRMKWETDDGEASSETQHKPVEGPNFTVTLKPMEIRTFEVKIVALHHT